MKIENVNDAVILVIVIEWCIAASFFRLKDSQQDHLNEIVKKDFVIVYSFNDEKLVVQIFIMTISVCLDHL